MAGLNAASRVWVLGVLLWMAPVLAFADDLSGKQLFTACSGCHSLEAGAPHGVGPNLHALAGRTRME